MTTLQMFLEIICPGELLVAHGAGVGGQGGTRHTPLSSTWYTAGLSFWVGRDWKVAAVA